MSLRALMNALRKYTLSTVILVGSVPVYADWQYTSWGMSSAEVKQAAKGMAPTDGGRDGDRTEGYQVGNVGEYTSGTHRFRSVFYFVEEKLEMVKLNKIDSGSCLALFADLRGVYGKEFSLKESSVINIWVWHDSIKNNHIGLVSVGNKCSLSYKPLVSDNNKGL